MSWAVLSGTPTIQGAAPPVSFNAPKEYSVPGYAALAADLHGDGKLDLVALQDGSQPGSVQILLGAGHGTFHAGPQGIAVGDFNGDHKADLAVASSGSKNVTVLINTTR